MKEMDRMQTIADVASDAQASMLSMVQAQLQGADEDTMEIFQDLIYFAIEKMKIDEFRSMSKATWLARQNLQKIIDQVLELASGGVENQLSAETIESALKLLCPIYPFC